MLDFDAGYILRGRDQFPQQGTSGPWTVEMDYWADHARLRKGPVEDAALRFSTASRTPVDRRSGPGMSRPTFIEVEGTARAGPGRR